jgi:hypothetical protein
MEVKRKRLPTKKREASIGYEEERSQSNTWDKYVEFGASRGFHSGAPSA